MPNVKLQVSGLGHVPSFKNNKMIVKGRGGRKAMLITDPKKQQWMGRCITAIESRLRSLFQTTSTATETACSLQSKIASSLPLDDSLKWIGSHSVDWRKVPKGQEGFEMTIEVV